MFLLTNTSEMVWVGEEPSGVEDVLVSLKHKILSNIGNYVV
ncbi:hypothetical protein [Bdellovibrio sp. HCB274]